MSAIIGKNHWWEASTTGNSSGPHLRFAHHRDEDVADLLAAYEAGVRYTTRRPPWWRRLASRWSR